MKNKDVSEIKQGNRVVKRHSFDLDESIVKKLKLQSVKTSRPMYVLVEAAIRSYLEEIESPSNKTMENVIGYFGEVDKEIQAIEAGWKSKLKDLKISKILEMTIDKSIAEISKEDLGIEEKEVRRTLKYAGCYVLVGNHKWLIDEDEVDSGVLNRPFYEVHQERLDEEMKPNT